MKPIHDVGPGIKANVNLTADGCDDLPAVRTDWGFLSCWELTPEEVAEVVRTGRIWLSVLGDGHPPVALAAREEDVFQKVERH